MTIKSCNLNSKLLSTIVTCDSSHASNKVISGRLIQFKVKFLQQAAAKIWNRNSVILKNGVI